MDTTGSNTTPDLDTFAARLQQLGALAHDPSDQGAVDTAVALLHSRGFSTADAAMFVACMEEVNPGLDEDSAVACMDALARRYPEAG